MRLRWSKRKKEKRLKEKRCRKQRRNVESTKRRREAGNKCGEYLRNSEEVGGKLRNLKYLCYL